MADEVSSIGVRLTLDASNFTAGMKKATAQTDAFAASTEKAATVAGGKGGPGKATRSPAAQNLGVPVDLSVSPEAIAKLRTQITKELGVIEVQVRPVVASKAVRGEAEAVVAAQVTPVIGSRSGAATSVKTAVKRNLPERATGGPVWPGQDFVVGERRPEVVRFAQRGTIIPDMDALRRRELDLARREGDKQRQHELRMQTLKRRPGGVEFTSSPTRFGLQVNATRRGQHVGVAEFERTLYPRFPRRDPGVPLGQRMVPPGEWEPARSEVIPTERGKGIGSWMYVEAERQLKSFIRPSEIQSPYARRMWADPRRPFGGDPDATYGQMGMFWRARRMPHRAHGGPAKKGGLPRGYSIEFWSPSDTSSHIGPERVLPRGSKPVKKPVFMGEPGFRSPQAALYGQIKYRDQVVGTFPFSYDSIHDALSPEMSWVHEEHRRKGLATAMYVKAERFTGRPVMPADTQLLPGRALWSQPDRPFGKRFGQRPLSPSDYLELGREAQALGQMAGPPELATWRAMQFKRLRASGASVRDAAQLVQGKELSFTSPLGPNYGVPVPWRRAGGGEVRELLKRRISGSASAEQIGRYRGQIAEFIRLRTSTGPQAREDRLAALRSGAVGPMLAQFSDYANILRHASASEQKEPFPSPWKSDTRFEAIRRALGSLPKVMKEPGMASRFWKRQMAREAVPFPGAGADLQAFTQLGATEGPLQLPADELPLEELSRPLHIREGRWTDPTTGLVVKEGGYNDLGYGFSRNWRGGRVRARRMADGGRVDISGIEPNFRRYLDMATPEQFRAGKRWYAYWGKQLRKQAQRLGIEPKLLASTAAALSPNNGWPGNFEDAIRYAEAYRAGLPMPKASTFGPNQRKAWDILHHQTTAFLRGLKVRPFSAALLGDPNARPQDLWMKRAAVGDLRLSRRQGTPSARQRREMDRVIDALAQERGLQPRQIQAIIWTVARELGFEQSGTATHARMRQAGGDVESFFHAAPARGVAGAFETAAGWARDPFMAWMAWEGQKQEQRARGGRVDRVGRPRIARDFAGQPMPYVPPDYYWMQQGPEGLHEEIWQEAMATKTPYHAWAARSREHLKSYASEVSGRIRPSMWWATPQRELGQKVATANIADLAAGKKILPHWTGGAVHAAGGATWLKGDWPITGDTMRKMADAGGYSTRTSTYGSEENPVTGLRQTVKGNAILGYRSIGSRPRKRTAEELRADVAAHNAEMERIATIEDANAKIEAYQAARETPTQAWWRKPPLVTAMSDVPKGEPLWSAQERTRETWGTLPVTTGYEYGYRSSTEAERNIYDEARGMGTMFKPYYPTKPYRGVAPLHFTYPGLYDEEGRPIYRAGREAEAPQPKAQLGFDYFGIKPEAQIATHEQMAPPRDIGPFVMSPKIKAIQAELEEALKTGKLSSLQEKGIDEAIRQFKRSPEALAASLGEGGGGGDFGYNRESAKKWTFSAYGARKSFTPTQYKKRWRALFPEAETAVAPEPPAARTVPQHEAPPVIAHAAIADAGLARRATRQTEAARMGQLETEAARRAEMGPMYGPPVPGEIPGLNLSHAEAVERLRGLGLKTISRGVRPEKPEPTIEELLGRKVPWARAGGGETRGLYMVNELGPEAFISRADMGKLAQNRPDILARIPGATDGMRSGMIQKPAWSLFAPRQDGYIVRREDAQGALRAVRAQRGAGVGDEDISASPGPIWTPPRRDVGVRAFRYYGAGEIAPIRPYRPRSEETVAMGRELGQALRRDVFGPNAARPFADALRSAVASAGAAGEVRPQAMVSLVGQRVAGSRARAARAAAAGPREAQGMEDLVSAWEDIGSGLEASSHVAAQMREALQSGVSPQALLELPNMVRQRAVPIGEGLEAPSGRTALNRAALEFGRASYAHARRRAGEPTEMEERLALLRSETAGVAAYHPTRTARGAISVLGEMLFGGGQEFRRRQAELQTARTLYNVKARDVVTAEKEVEVRKLQIGWLQKMQASEEDLAAPTKELADWEQTLGASRKELTARTERLNKASEAVQPSASGVIRAFGSIVLATSAYGAAFSAANELMVKGKKSVADFADEMAGFTAKSQQVTGTLAQQLPQVGGNLTALFGQVAQQAGLGAQAQAYYQQALTPAIVAKAAATAQQQTSDLYRATLGKGAPTGLFGGYGGLFGGALLAPNKGFTETIAGDISQRLGQTDLLSQAGEQTGLGLGFLTNKTQRNFVLNAGGGPLKLAGDLLGGIGNLARSPLIPSLPGIGKNWNTASLLANFFGGSTTVPFAPTPAAPPMGEHSQFYAPQGFVPEVKAGRTGDELKGLDTYLGDLNDAAKRGAQAVGEQTKATYDYAESQKEITDGTRAAIQAGDQYGLQMAQQGIVLRKAGGAVVATGEDYTKAIEQMARGKTIPTPEAFAAQQQQQIRAQLQATDIVAQRQTDITNKFAIWQNLIQAPLITPGIGFFRGGQGGLPGAGQVARAGVTGGAASTVTRWLQQAQDTQGQITQLAAEGLKAQRDDVMKYLGPAAASQFDELTGAAQKASAAIANTTIKLLKIQQAANQANWDNQIRIAQRSLGDALGLLGKVGATRLGQLQREDYLIGRAQQRLGFQLQQYQINFATAMAGFQAPGLTSEERAARQAEAKLEARYAQKQLNLSVEQFNIAGQIWRINAERAATDAGRAIHVMQTARNAEAAAVAAQVKIAAKQQLVAAALANLAALTNKSDARFQTALSAATSYVGQFGGSVKAAILAVYNAIGVGAYYNRRGQLVLPSQPKMGGRSMGYLGTFAQGALMTVGEAGPETVAILRNPRTHMLQGGGGGTYNVVVNLNMTVQGDVKDEATVAKIVRAVEDSFNRKGARLGLRTFVSAAG